MREITTHHVDGAPNPVRVFATDEPDHDGGGGACHEYAVEWEGGHGIDDSALIRFQHGPIKEHGVNGLTNEALLAIVIDRLECFQAGPFACDENMMAMAALIPAMHWLQKRTVDRIARGVEGENKQ